MRIEISASGFRVTPELREYVLRRLHFKLGRFSERIDLARVKIVEVNGPRGGVDLHCRIQVFGADVDGLVTSALAANLRSAIDEAAGHIHCAVGRELARASEKRRRRRPSHARLP